MGPVEQLAYILPTLSSVVEGIHPSKLYEPAGPDDATVHDLLDEMIVLGGACADWFRGLEATERLAPPVYGRVPAAEYREVMDDLLAAVKAPGLMNRMLVIPGGMMDAETVARELALDALTHGRDIAPFSSRRFELPPAVTAAAEAFALEQAFDDARSDDIAKSDASPLERLVSTGGRSS